MNKKIIVLIISIVILVGGIIFWQFLKQNTPIPSAAKNNNRVQNTEKKLVEIFHLPHPPAKAIVEKVDKILQKFPKYKVKKYDFYDESNEQKINAYNLTGHIPVAIIINGTNTFSINGKKITFKNFPKGDAFVPTLEGSWSYKDLEKVLANPNKYKNGK